MLTQEESIARSEVDDAPLGVPWEILHGEAVGVRGERGKVQEASRAQKRVRIRSPVPVIETPERRGDAFGCKSLARGGGSKDGLDADREASLDEEGEGDKSRVVVGEESDSDEEQADRSNSVLPSIVVDETSATVPSMTSESRSNLGADQSDPERSDLRYDLSLLAGIPFSRATAAIQTDTTTSASATTAPVEQATRESQSASSLQIRPPIPAAVPQATCRFTFFSKRPPQASTSLLTIDPLPEEPSTQLDAPPPPPPPLPAHLIRQNNRSPPIHTTLPTMNAFTATYDSLPLPPTGGPNDSLEQHSIIPPPTLHFSLSSITPLARIIAHPMHYVSSSTTRFGANVGGVSSKVNLLVVVKEVGEVVRVRSRVVVDPPQAAGVGKGVRRSVRGEMGKGVGRAFEEALRGQQQEGVGDGRTERLELIVMDGRMSPVQRLIHNDDSSERSVVEEPEEKSLFTVILWGQLARSWSTPTPTSHPTTLTPTPLQPGDILSLTNLSLSLTPQLPININIKKRLGTGLPPPPSTKLSLAAAHASLANKSQLELCYRSHVKNIVEDGWRNFDDDVARFDVKSRRVLELCRLWRCQRF